MKIDTYTKVMLTIIAVCLVWLSVGGPSMIAVAHKTTGRSVWCWLQAM